MTVPKVLMVSEGTKTLFIGSSRAYSIDFSGQGTPDDAGASTMYDSDGAAQAGLITGSPAISGDIVTTQKFTPVLPGTYRLIQTVTISGQLALGVVDISVHAVVPPTAAAKTIATGSYSSLSEVATLVPRYANRSGTFDDKSRPTAQGVVVFIDQISAIVDMILAQYGFATPVTDTEVKRVLDSWVSQEVASFCEGVNGSGRFGPTGKTGGARGRYALVYDDVEEFIAGNEVGFERMGATREYSAGSSIGYRGTDESGEDIFPVRQRKEFGNRFDNWDS